MTSRLFTILWIGLVFLVLGLIAAFPLILLGVFKLTDCASVGGACGAVALIAGLYGRSYIVLFALVALVVLVALRLRALRLPMVLVLQPAFMFLAAAPLVVLANNFWAVGFVAGSSPHLAFVAARQPLIYLFLTLIGLSLMTPPRSLSLEEERRLIGNCLAAVSLCAIVMHMMAVLAGMSALPYMGHLAAASMRATLTSYGFAYSIVGAAGMRTLTQLFLVLFVGLWLMLIVRHKMNRDEIESEDVTIP